MIPAKSITWIKRKKHRTLYSKITVSLIIINQKFKQAHEIKQTSKHRNKQTLKI